MLTCLINAKGESSFEAIPLAFSNTIILQGKYDLIYKYASFYHVNVSKPVDAVSSHTTLMQKVHLHLREYH